MAEKAEKNKKKTRRLRWAIVSVLAAFILICMLTDSFLLGGFGHAVRGFFVGVLGAAGYVWIAALTVYSALKAAEKRFNVPALYAVNFILMFVFTVLLAHLITAQAGGQARLVSFSFGDYLKDCFSESMSFGGVVAALIIYPVYNTVGAFAAYAIIILLLIVTTYFAAKFFSDRKAGDSLASSFFENKIVARDKSNAMFVENLNEPLAVTRIEPRSSSEKRQGERSVDIREVTNGGDPALRGKDKHSGRIKQSDEERGKEKPIESSQESARSILFSKDPPSSNASYTDIYEDESRSRKPKGEFETAPRSVFDQRPPKILHDSDPIQPIISQPNPAASLFSKRGTGEKSAQVPLSSAPRPARDLSAYKNMIIKDVDASLPPIINSDAILENRRDTVIKEKNDRASEKFEDELTGVDLTSLIRKKAEPLGNAVFGYKSDYENSEQKPIISSLSEMDIDEDDIPVSGEKSLGKFGYKREKDSVSSILSDMFKGTSDNDALRTGPAIDPLFVPLKKNDDNVIDFNPLRKPFSELSSEERQKTVAVVEKPLSGGGGAQMSMEEKENLPELPLRKEKYRPYNRPSIELLDSIQEGSVKSDDLIAKGKKLEEGLEQFGIRASVENIISGPTVALFEFELAAGISVKQISKYSDDLARHIESRSGLRIIPHIPGKSYFGIEAPHNVSRLVTLRELIGSKEFRAANNENRLYFTLGVDVQGTNVIADLSDMPHLLVGGSTGTGKSVCLNSLILSLMFKYSPDELRFILVDPKRVEFHMFNGMPHMLLPNAVVESDKALNAFNYLIDEMERRYILFQHYKVKDLTSFNKLIDPKLQEPFPRIVLIVDELSDLMSYNKSEIESKILRLAQKARASGIHLVLATQRPSVDVVTGTIKSNLPARIALRVISQNDSKTILDTGGPEKLLGKGDMLFQREGSPRRVQGVYVSTEEVIRIVDYVKANNECNFSEEAHKEILERKPTVSGAKGNKEEEKEVSGIGAHSRENDPLFMEALRHVIIANAASISMIQRKLNIGFGRAGNIVDTMEKLGYVSGTEQNKARSVLITKEMFNDMFGSEYGTI